MPAEIPEQATSRPGRLRWLQGVGDSGDSWQAYGAPEGVGLRAWAEADGPLGWSELCQVLIGVCQEIDADGHAEEWRGRSPDHVWVDAAGSAKLLPFPLTDDRA